MELLQEDLHTSLGKIREKYAYIERFFHTNGLPLAPEDQDLAEYFDGLGPVLLEDMGTSSAELKKRFLLFIERMENLRKGSAFTVDTIEILPGKNKSGRLEGHGISISAGSIVCIVGPTGSGKSRLLADIDWMAQRDTPTGRKILINGKEPENEWRFSVEYKLVAQLSQNMNYVMDLSVREFIRIHAECRLIEDVDAMINTVLTAANELSGEKFSENTPLTSLSGGQSRALMVADTAYLSSSPIVLIDEIENAGIHRQKALDLLVGKDKVVLIVTHDPLLALMGERRIVIKNGGIFKILQTSDSERMEMAKLRELDRLQQQYREQLRNGEEMSSHYG